MSTMNVYYDFYCVHNNTVELEDTYRCAYWFYNLESWEIMKHVSTTICFNNTG